MASNDRHIVIIGGGIIGCCTAYFLTRHPSFDPKHHKITLLETSKIAGGASGKAGGLLALWAYPKEIVPLSYRTHKELAEKHNGAKRWDYRPVHCGQIECKGRVPDDLDWIEPECLQGYEEMSDPTNSAQVHPFLFTTAMAELAKEAGADIRVGAQVKSITYNDKGDQVTGVTYVDKESGRQTGLQATDVVISAGPWTSTVYPSAPISALRAHSVTIKPTRPVSAYTLFTSIKLPAGFGRTDEARRSEGKRSQIVTPEIYARQTEIYACGEGDRLVPLPQSTDEVQVDETRCQDVVDYACSVSDELRDGVVTARQACYLPEVNAKPGHPLIGPTGVKGLWMCAGHTCWGIQNGPGSGKLMSEFIFDGKAKSANVAAMDPRAVL
ncbi:hypothetical protein ANO11243_017600 [Dothideomycetidae sp. 11243]|nr:hypothetical protein ANO11243_017600 [fungal sp. No.11243]